MEEKEGLLNKEDKMFAWKKAQRRAFIEQSLQEVAEKLTDDMICKMESKTFIRGAYYLASELLTRAYHQGTSIAREKTIFKNLHQIRHCQFLGLYPCGCVNPRNHRIYNIHPLISAGH